MKTFVNDYQELNFIKEQPQYCKVKEQIKFEVREINRQTKVVRQLLTLKHKLKKFLNISKSQRIIRLSNHVCNFGKKELKANITTIIKKYENKQIVTVHTDINNRYLQKI